MAAVLAQEGILNKTGILDVDSAQTPGQQATAEAALAAGSGRRSANEQIELSWSHSHPSGQAEQEGTLELLLWNFDVGSAALKPEHEAALRSFTKIFALAEGLTTYAAGYASSTGTESRNVTLADQRAQAVADWCNRNGLNDVAVINGGISPMTDDGESFARGRSARLTFPESAKAAAPPPRYLLLPASETAPPMVVQCTVGNTFEVAVGPIPVYTLPPNGWIEGVFSFTGTIRYTFKDAQACAMAQETVNASGSGGATKITVQITDGFAARLSSIMDWDKGLTGALTALVGDGPWKWEVGLQTGVNMLVIKSPSFSLTDLLGGGSNIATWDFDGHQASVQITGQVQFAGRPGALLMEPILKWSQALEIGAMEALTIAWGIGTAAATFYLTIDGAVNAEADGLRIAGLYAQRMGFAGELAALITPGATDNDADLFLQGWEAPSLKDARNLVDHARRKAYDQLRALGDQGEAKISELRQKYTRDPQTGKPLAYDAVAAAILEALGGASGTGGAPSLELL